MTIEKCKIIFQKIFDCRYDRGNGTLCKFLHRGSLAGKPKPGCVFVQKTKQIVQTLTGDTDVVTCVGCGIANRRAPTKVRGAKA